MGSGIPGPENWSMTDEATIRKTPLGGIPEMVEWSASVVLTPNGFVGRVDNYLNGKTIHCPVEPSLAEVSQQLRDISAEKLRKQLEERRKEAQAGRADALTPGTAWRQSPFDAQDEAAYGLLDDGGLDDPERLDAEETFESLSDVVEYLGNKYGWKKPLDVIHEEILEDELDEEGV